MSEEKRNRHFRIIWPFEIGIFCSVKKWKIFPAFKINTFAFEVGLLPRYWLKKNWNVSVSNIISKTDNILRWDWIGWLIGQTVKSNFHVNHTAADSIKNFSVLFYDKLDLKHSDWLFNFSEFISFANSMVHLHLQIQGRYLDHQEASPLWSAFLITVIFFQVRVATSLLSRPWSRNTRTLTSRARTTKLASIGPSTRTTRPSSSWFSPTIRTSKPRPRMGTLPSFVPFDRFLKSDILVLTILLNSLSNLSWTKRSELKGRNFQA